jgi:hypothetical protein
MSKQNKGKMIDIALINISGWGTFYLIYRLGIKISDFFRENWWISAVVLEGYIIVQCAQVIREKEIKHQNA